MQTKEDIIKFIDGDIFYRYDYAAFLYDQLKAKDILISIKSKRIQDLLKRLSKKQNNINRAMEYLERKQKEPSWYDTDFIICKNLLQGGTGKLKDIRRRKNDNKRSKE